MTGKIAAITIVVIALLFGAAVYYLQEFYYYEELPAGSVQIALVPKGADAPVAIPAEAVSAIDATSSPIRFRACFTTPLTLEELSETYEPYPAAEPLNAPYWFGCFDAQRVGEALETGAARAFLATPEVHEGVDRVVAVLPGGEGYAWQQLNERWKDK